MGGKSGRAPLWRTRRGRYGNGLVLAWLTACVTALLVRVFVPVPSWLVVHLFTLGAATTAVLLWSEHFLVTWTGMAAPSARSLTCRTVALAAATVLVIIGVVTDTTIVTLIGTAGVALVAAWHGLVLWRGIRCSTTRRFGHLGGFYLTATMAFFLTVALAALVVVDRGAAAGWLILAHLHLAVFGWLGMAVLGTLLVLWPTVLRTRMVAGASRAGRAALWPLITGLTVTGAGLVMQQQLVAVVGMLSYAAGVAVSLIPFVRTFRNRSPRSGAGWMLAAGTGWLVVAVLYDAALLATTADPNNTLAHTGVLVRLLLAGFVAQVLVGALTYLLVTVFGGGPRLHRRSSATLERASTPRVVLTNLAVPLVAVPAPTALHVVGWALLGSCYGGFVLLALRAGSNVGAFRILPRSPQRDTSSPRQ